VKLEASRLAFGAALALALLVLVWVWGGSSASTTAQPPAEWLQTRISLLGAGGANDQESATAHPSAAPTRSFEAVENALFVHGSLRGAQLDGGWGNFGPSGLQPSLELRLRFDQLLSTIGEVSTTELRLFVQALAERDLGKAGADAVLSLWDRYLALQQQPLKTAMDLQKPERWLQTLSEQSLARRQALGPAWADAFYRSEEQALREALAQRQAAADSGGAIAVPSDPLRPHPQLDALTLHQERIARYGAQAAQRLQAEDAHEAAWDARVTQAAQQIARFQQAPELSPPQRDEATRRWIDEHFTGTERIRVRALLDL
jgi:lipase chaperone LimK